MSEPDFTNADHRPWPRPESGWSWRQTWADILFLHWRVPERQIRPLIPEELELDTFDGECWLTVMPFRMIVTQRALPVKWDFNEINMRVNVTRDDKPGGWLLSVDATNALAVWAVKRWFGFPYERSTIKLEETDEFVSLHCTRGSASRLHVDYGPAGRAFKAEPGTLDHWLTERYCIYAPDRRGRLCRTEFHHAPIALQPATAKIHANSMADAFGISLNGSPDAAHFARHVDVAFWTPAPLVG